jgi:L-cysteine:1D-myo-inositol 2-amino-2-deoxy-alpha-D-glucopyranoside ligase
MSKSRGNLVFVDALRRRYDPRAIRLGLLSKHYRNEWEWDAGLIERATVRLGAWARSVVHLRMDQSDEKGSSVMQSVRERLDDDLDTPGALAAVDAAAAAGLDVRAAASLLGVEL